MNNVETFLVISGIVLLVCGLPWLLIRKYIHNNGIRRFGSSFILAMAFAPGVFGGDFGAYFVPAIVVIIMPLTGDLIPPINLLISLLTVLILSSIIYGVRGSVDWLLHRQ